MRLQKLLKICLMAIIGTSAGCANFPELHPHIISLKNGLCGEYEVVKQNDACDIEYRFKQWHPIEKCEGYFALPPSDITELKKYQVRVCNNKKTRAEALSNDRLVRSKLQCN